MDKFVCICGKSYAQKPSLCRHHKTCNEYNNISTQNNNISAVKSVDISQQHIQTDIQSKYEEQMQKLISDNNLLNEKLKKIEADNIQLHKQVIELQERERNMMIEQIKLLQSQLCNKSETIKPVEEKNVNSVKPVEVKQTNKKTSVKTYLASCSPVTFTEFMNNYIPTIEDYSNVISYGIQNGAIKNIVSYVSQLKKENYPIIITNQQLIRMRMLVYDTDDSVYQWKTLLTNDAIIFLEKMVERFINKLYKYINVLKTYYPGIDDKDHRDEEIHTSYYHAFYSNTRYSDNYIKDIVNGVKEQFLIISNTDYDVNE